MKSIIILVIVWYNVFVPLDILRRGWRLIPVSFFSLAVSLQACLSVTVWWILQLNPRPLHPKNSRQLQALTVTFVSFSKKSLMKHYNALSETWKKNAMGRSYVSLAEEFVRFDILQHIPMDLKLERLNDHDGIKSALLRHKAGWHKSCKLKLNKRAFEVLSKKLSKSTE